MEILNHHTGEGAETGASDRLVIHGDRIDVRCVFESKCVKSKGESEQKH